MKKLKTILVSTPLLVVVTGIAVGEENVRYASAVQLVVQEVSPKLQTRAHRIVVDGFSNVIASAPQLRAHSYRVVTRGNEVALYFDSSEDLRKPFQDAFVAFVQTVVRDQIRGAGRISFSRIDLDQDPQRYFHVAENPITRRISFRAKGVPLRDVLRELRSRFGGVSYLLPGECGDEIIEGNFERPRNDVTGAMKEIARIVGLQAEVRNGAYLFSGSCGTKPTRYHHAAMPFVTQVGMGGGRPVHVLLPLPPLPVETIR